MAIEQVIPEIIRKINIEKWGERRAAVVELVAQLSIPGYWVEIDPLTLQAALGRDPRMAHYDHDAMVALTDPAHRVLSRRAGGGHRPDAWRVNCVCRWRNVPFKSSRKKVISDFCSCRRKDDMVQMFNRAARAVALMTSESLDRPTSTPDPRTDDLVSAPHHLSSNPQAQRVVGLEPGNGATEPERSSPSSLLSENPPSLSPPEGVSERGVAAKPESDLGTVLLAAVRTAVRRNTDVTGRHAGRVRDVGRSRPDLLDALISHARTLDWVKTGSGAAEAMEGELERLIFGPAAHATPDRARRLVVLRGLVGALDDDDPKLAECLEEIAQLETSITDLQEA